MKKYSALFVLSLLSGCTKVKIGPEFEKLQKRTEQAVGSSIIFDNDLYDALEDIPSMQHALHDGLSRNEAVSIALLNNPTLQADFQNLGIAKADLVQAGLYTNPSLDSVFRFPTRDLGPGSAQTNIETVAAFRLSDLWQVPLAKHVAEDLLEIVSLRILSTILTTIAEIKMAYDACLAAEMQWHNIKDLLKVTREWHDEVYYRQLYGYTADIDKDRADAKIGMLETDLRQRQLEVYTSYLHLKKLMGITPSSKPLKLSDALYEDIAVPELGIIEHYALTNRPEMQIAHMKIRQYKHTVVLEQAKVFKVVDIGIGYKQDFERPFRGWGPYFNITLPIFDDNYAQVARAEFLLKQAEKELAAEKIRIREEVRKPYKSIQALRKEIDYYKNVVLPSHEKAIDYAYIHVPTMQLPMTTALESTIQWYEAHALFIDKQYHLMKERTQLERALGKKMEIY